MTQALLCLAAHHRFQATVHRAAIAQRDPREAIQRLAVQAQRDIGPRNRQQGIAAPQSLAG